MNEDFEKEQIFKDELKNLIKSGSLEDFVLLMENQKKSYKGSKLNLFYNKFKDFIFDKNNYKYSKFMEISISTTLDDVFDCVIENERKDILNYFFKNGYIDSEYVLGRCGRSQIMLENILTNGLYDDLLKSNKDIYEKLIDNIIFVGKEDLLEYLIKEKAEEIKNINQNQMENLLIFTIKRKENGLFKKLYDFSVENNFNVNFLREKSHYGISQEKFSLLTEAIKQKNTEITNYILNHNIFLADKKSIILNFCYLEYEDVTKIIKSLNKENLIELKNELKEQFNHKKINEKYYLKLDKELEKIILKENISNNLKIVKEKVTKI